MHIGSSWRHWRYWRQGCHERLVHTKESGTRACSDHEVPRLAVTRYADVHFALWRDIAHQMHHLPRGMLTLYVSTVDGRNDITNMQASLLRRPSRADFLYPGAIVATLGIELHTDDRLGGKFIVEDHEFVDPFASHLARQLRNLMGGLLQPGPRIRQLGIEVALLGLHRYAPCFAGVHFDCERGGGKHQSTAHCGNC